jgi:hypothetical protein
MSNPFVRNPLTGTADFRVSEPFWQQVASFLPPPIVVNGMVLTIQKLVERVQQSVLYFNIGPWKLKMFFDLRLLSPNNARIGPVHFWNGDLMEWQCCRFEPFTIELPQWDDMNRAQLANALLRNFVGMNKNFLTKDFPLKVDRQRALEFVCRKTHMKSSLPFFFPRQSQTIVKRT